MTYEELSEARLTERDWQVARGLAGDLPVKAIALELGMSRKTVEYYWGRLKQKLGVRSHVGLVRWMVAEGIYERAVKA